MFYVLGIFTILSAMLSAGFAVKAAGMPKSAGTNGRYALTRSFALLCVAVAAIIVGSRDILFAISFSMIIIQAFDAIVGMRTKNKMRIIVPAFTAVINFIFLLIFIFT